MNEAIDYTKQITQNKYAKKPIPLPISCEYIYELSKQSNNRTTEVLIDFLYLTGARVSEAQEVTVADFNNHDQNGVNQITVQVHTRKKRHGIGYRIIPIKSSSITERKMLNRIVQYREAKKKALGLNAVLFPLSKVHLWRKLHALKFTTQVVIRSQDLKTVINNYEMRLHPHYLRHCRATHLVNDYGFNPFALQAVMGWSSVTPANVYVSLDWRTASRLLLGLNKLDSDSLTPSDSFEATKSSESHQTLNT